MAKGIHLVSVDAKTGNAVVQYNGDTQNNVTVQGAYNGTDTVIIPGWGTFKANNKGRTTFTGEAGLSGELNISIADNVAIVSGKTPTLANVDFRASSSGVKFSGGGNNGDIYGGTGNDTITVKDNVNVFAGAGNDIVEIQGGNTNSVNLGTGADTLVVTGGEVTVTDYNYYEGDVIKAKGQAKFDSSKFTLTKSGSTNAYVTAAYVTAPKVAVQDNWYAARVDDGTDIVDFFSAVAGSNVTKDFSKSTIKNAIYAGKAKAANITLGSGDDGVLFSSGVDTVKVGKSSGNNVFEQFGTDDIIAIDGVKVSDLTYTSSKANEITINYAATKITINRANDTIGTTNINDGSQTHKLAYVLGQNEIIGYTGYSDADWIIGATDGSTTL